MRTRMVSHTEWRSFFRDFSRIHDGVLVTISVAEPGTAVHEEVLNQSLRGIREDDGEIFVHTGGCAGGEHLANRIRNVNSVVLQQTDEGADAEVDIASMDGSQTAVRFRTPALPELLDPGVE